MLDLCYNEDFPELHRELLSLEIDVKKTKNYEQGVENIYDSISLYAGDEFPRDVFSEITEIYQDFLDSLQF